MSCLGVLFSISLTEVNKLRSFSTDEERLEHLQESLEEVYFDEYPQYVAELDKSWDALHRSLTDGRLEDTNGLSPLNYVILGGEALYTDDDYIMSLKSPEEVKEVAKAIEVLDKPALKKRYYSINESHYGFPLTEEDFEYTWHWLEQSKTFWKTAATENRYVLFTVDQ